MLVQIVPTASVYVDSKELFLLTGRPMEVHHNDFYKAKFMAAVRLWRKQDEDKKVLGNVWTTTDGVSDQCWCRRVTFTRDFTQVLLHKVAQLEEALTQKDKFIHSSRMIVKFREDHICRLEKKLKEGGGSLANSDSQTVIDQLKDEIKILRDQVQHIGV